MTQLTVSQSPSPPPIQALNLNSQTIDISILVKNKRGGTETIALGGIPNPVAFEDVARRVVERGFERPKAIVSLRRPDHHVEITEESSSFVVGRGGKINLDQPLLHFYHRNFLPAACPKKFNTPQSGVNESEATIDEQQVLIGRASITFNRTIRVPDNDKDHSLPPGLGAFPLFNIGNFLNRLPGSVLRKGGICMSMYQREAMWMSFSAKNGPCAMKISVGGINALTGLPQNAPSDGKQDYLAINDGSGQLWLDGISIAPGVIRQFVAMPLGQGYTVEGQLTGSESVGGIQIDVYPKFSTTVIFQRDGQELDIYKSPRELGLESGTLLRMVDTDDGYVRTVLGDADSVRSSVHLSVPTVEFESSDDIYIVFVKNPNGNGNRPFGRVSPPPPSLQILPNVSPSRPSQRPTPPVSYIAAPLLPTNSIADLKSHIQTKENILPTNYDLIYRGTTLEDGKTLRDYEVISGAEVQLVMKPPPTLSFFGMSRSRAVKAPSASLLSGFAAGGRISQKINRDIYPAAAYDQTRASRLHVTVINAVHFTSVTGLPSPPCPISAQTYIQYGYPWFDLYDEHIPSADNAVGPTPLTDVASIAEIDSKRIAEGRADAQEKCASCDYAMATIALEPCDHRVCDKCALQKLCPSCKAPITSQKRFAASMPMVGGEDEDGVESGSLNQSIVKLHDSALRGKVLSFWLKDHAVHGLCSTSSPTVRQDV